MTAHQFEFQMIDGSRLELASLAGKPILVVNTASRCGFTPQYRDLEGLWNRYAGRIAVIGVPSNDFGAQEPGTEVEIQEFCSINYSVSFPLTAKQQVIGAEAHPFYQWIVSEAGEDARPRWNFHKYLIDAEGRISQIYPSKVGPLDATLIRDIEALLVQ